MKTMKTGPRAETQRISALKAASPVLMAMSGEGEGATRARKRVRRKMERQIVWKGKSK